MTTKLTKEERRIVRNLRDRVRRYEKAEAQCVKGGWYSVALCHQYAAAMARDIIDEITTGRMTL